MIHGTDWRPKKQDQERKKMIEQDISPINRLRLSNIYTSKGLTNSRWILNEMEEPLSQDEWEKLHGSCSYPDGTPLPDGIFSNSHIDGYIRMVTDGKWLKFCIPQPDGTDKKATAGDIIKLALEEDQRLKKVENESN